MDLTTDILGDEDGRYEFKAVCLSTIGGLWIVYGVILDRILLFGVKERSSSEKGLGRE